MIDFIKCLAISVCSLLLFFFLMDYYCLKQTVRSQGRIQAQLITEQRPLVTIPGKYTYVGVKDRELIIVEDKNQ